MERRTIHNLKEANDSNGSGSMVRKIVAAAPIRNGREEKEEQKVAQPAKT